MFLSDRGVRGVGIRFDHGCLQSVLTSGMTQLASPEQADPSFSDPVIGANDGLDEAVERRQHQRGVAVLKTAKLVSDGEHLCLVRNISSGGLLADIHVPIEIGAEVVVLLNEEHPLVGIVAWARGQSIGVRFHEEVDVAAQIAALGSRAGDRRARMPRLEIDAWARVRVGARVFSVRVCNISQGGARVRIHGLNSAGAAAVISMQALRPVEGVVRWCHASHAGISFNQPLGLRELMLWLQSQDERMR